MKRNDPSSMWLEDLRRDTMYALGMLVRSPAFTLVAILTLSLAIGANAAIFTVVDHVLVRSLPVPDADRLVRLYSSSPRVPTENASMDDVGDWRGAASSFEMLTAFGGTTLLMTGDAGPERIVGMLVEPGFFPLTGVRMPLGQPFMASDYVSPGNAALATFGRSKNVQSSAAIILSDQLWRRQFGADPQVVGRHVRLNSLDAIVAGVMPADFQFADTPTGKADCWIPLVESQFLGKRRYRQLIVIGRLKPDVSIAATRAEMNAIALALQKSHPAELGERTVHVEPLKESITGGVRPTLLILLGGVGCVLLVACANVAGLFVVRATNRRREVAVRVALGAGRGRLVRQWLTESTVLAIAAGMGGLLVAVWAVPALTAVAPQAVPRLAEIAVDHRTFLFTLVLSLTTGAVCGVAPLIGLEQRRTDVLRSFASIGRGDRRWLKSALITVQVALAVVLLVGSGLMARSLVAVHSLDLGFDPRNVLTFGVYLQRSPRYNTSSATREFARDLRARLSALPDVVAAGNGAIPLRGAQSDNFEVEGRPDPMEAALNVSSPGYFQALGVRLHRGRDFTDTDDGWADPVAIVNRAFAYAAWGTSDVLGRRLRISGENTWPTVVGIVGDTRLSSLEATPPPIVYLPYLQSTSLSYSDFVVRTSGPPMNTLSAVRDVVRQIDPSIPVTRVAAMDDWVRTFVAPREFNLWLIGLFSLLAFALAIVGLYGLVSEVVTARTPEIGVRMALGASRFHIVRLISGDSLLVTTAGLTLGLAGAVAVSRWLGSMIFGVTSIDPVTFVTVPIVLLVSSAIAAVAPARRAMHVDAVATLRRE